MKPEELLAHADFLHALAYSLVRDEHQAADMVQETMVKALEKQPDSIKNVRAWLAVVLRNFTRFTHRTEGRRRRRETAVAVPEGIPSSEEIIEEEEIRQKVVEAVLDIKGPYRSVLLLRFYRNLPQKEAARRLGIPLETVRSRQKKGLALLRQHLDFAYNGDRRKWVLSLAPIAAHYLTTPYAKAGAGASSLSAGVVIMFANLKIIVATALILGAAVFTVIKVIPEEPEESSRLFDVTGIESQGTEKNDKKIPSPQETSQQEKVVLKPSEGKEKSVPPREFGELTISGRFLDEEGNPVENVYICNRLYQNTPSTETGVNGRFTLNQAGRLYGEMVRVTLKATKSGYISYQHTIEAQEGEVFHLGDITLKPGGSVSGMVRDVEGNPCPNAAVWINDADISGSSENELRRFGSLGSPRILNINVNEDGTFIQEGVPVGWIRVWAKAEGMFYAYSEPIEIRAGEETTGVELVFECIPAEECIQGIVLSPEGEPVPEASVYLEYKVFLFGSGGFSVRTGMDGRFCACLEKRIDHDILVRDPMRRYSPAIVKSVPMGTENLEIRFSPKATLRTTIKTEGPRRLEDITIYLSSPEYSDISSLTTFRADEIDENGMIELKVPAMELELTAKAPGFESIETGRIDPFQPLELCFVSVPGIRGTVLLDQKPVAGARVSIHEEAERSRELRVNGLLCRSIGWASAWTLSNPDGSFDIALLTSGRFYLRAELDGYTAAEIGPMELNHEKGKTGLTLSFSKGGAIEGRVISSPGRDPSGVIVAISRGDGFGYTQRSDREGAYRFENLIPGRWFVTQWKTDIVKGDVDGISRKRRGFGGKPQYIPWVCVVEAGKTTEYNLNLTQETVPLVIGRFTLNGTPPEAWTATLQEENNIPGSAVPVDPEKTSLDSEGKFTLEGDRTGAHYIALSGQAGPGSSFMIRSRVHLEVGETPWSLDITTGRVIIKNIPESDQIAILLYKWEGSRDLVSYTRIVKDDTDSLTLTVPAGKGSIIEAHPDYTQPDGYTQIRLKEVEVPAGETVIVEM